MKLLIWRFFPHVLSVLDLTDPVSGTENHKYNSSNWLLICCLENDTIQVWNESIVDIYIYIHIYKYIYIRLMINTFLPCKTTGQNNKQVPKGLWSTGPNSEVMPARRRLNLAEWIFRTLMLILFTYVQSWKSQSHCFLMSKQHKRMWKKNPRSVYSRL